MSTPIPLVDSGASKAVSVYVQNGAIIATRETFPAVFTPVGVLGFAGVTTAYALLLAFSGGFVGELKVSNKLDRDVYLSFDSGTTDHWFLAAGETNILDLATNGYALTSSQDVYVKSIGGNAGAGNIYASGVSDS